MAHFLLLVLVIISAPVWTQVRYTFLPSRYNGLFDKEFTVASLDECSLAATAKNKIGFRVTIKSEEKKEMTCAFLRQFSGLVNRSDPNDYDFILDTKADDNVCLWNTVRNVSQFISGSCTVKGADCMVLENMKKFCTFVGTDTAECASHQYTVKNIECPSGQITVDLKKGKHLCCPSGEKLAEERNGKAYCCPLNKKLKGIFNGKAICCNPSDNYKTGTSFCCPTGKQYSSGNGLEHCCPSGLVPSKSTSGSIGCCPYGRTYVKTQNGVDHCCPNTENFVKREGGIDYCCPNGETFQGKRGEVAICCPNGNIYKEHYNGNKICCPTTDNYKAGTGRCCGSGLFYNKNNGAEACCPPNKYAARASNGYINCCKGKDDKLHIYTLGDPTYLRCCEPGTTFKLDEKAAKCVKN
ncbi:hypothetical protein QR680_004227 [Steinernema hermaphroditum]|uniref:Uncharacterized protein n=1 Tax=Steinernema hermaphroditum TaxID=289476 RepID=A0AA39HP42_9BILA|nr:hypothetical protein QR680_004227 [Steinernema hermaphroditum]